MTSIQSSIPTRVSGYAMRQQMLAQLQQGQASLLKIQQQLSTGARLQLPSDDPAAATRGMQLQRLLEQKDQMGINLRETGAFLDVTDRALQDTGDLLAHVRGLAVRAVDFTTSGTEREAIAVELQSAITQFLQVANTRFQGRYLFAGSDPNVVPFDDLGGKIAFRGNEQTLRSIADFGLLVESNLPGADVFGGFSEEVRGTADLNPVLREDTPLAELRGGEGVELGSLRISDGSNSTTVDLSGAATVGDVARLLTAAAPAGRELTVQITPTGLQLQLDAAGGGSLTVTEIDGGTTAAQLGIFDSSGAGTAPLLGTDLNPVVKLSTAIDDLLGVRARALLVSPGRNNDIRIEANSVGAAANGYAFQVVDDGLLQAAPGLNPGNEYVQFEPAPVAARAALTLTGPGNDLVLTANAPGTSANNIRIELQAAPLGGDLANATYDSVNRRLLVTIDDSDQTTAATLVNAINAQGLFTATPDSSMGETFNPAQTVNASDAGTVTGNTGNSGGDGNTFFLHVSPSGSEARQLVSVLNADPTFTGLFSAELSSLDTTEPTLAGTGVVDANASSVTADGSGTSLDTSGIQIEQDGQTYTVSFAGVQTVDELLNAIEGSGAEVSATINAAGTGIDVRSRLSGVDFSIGENGGQSATQLSLRTLNYDTFLSDLNYGRGVDTQPGADLVIHRRDGVDLQIDLDGAATVQDVLDRINNDPANLDPATAVTARLVDFGNGIEIVDSNTSGTDLLEVRRSAPSQAAWDLGLVPTGQTSVVASAGSTQSITGDDVRPLEVHGIFNSLIRLEKAVRTADPGEIERLVGLLDEDLDRLSFQRASLGARAQTVDALRTRLQDEQTELQSILSEKLDVNFAEAVSNFTARQLALQASMEVIGKTFQLTLLDFL